MSVKILFNIVLVSFPGRVVNCNSFWSRFLAPQAVLLQYLIKLTTLPGNETKTILNRILTDILIGPKLFYNNTTSVIHTRKCSVAVQQFQAPDDGLVGRNMLYSLVY
jgi:hypothetical protein